jgi:hypothetical protein
MSAALPNRHRARESARAWRSWTNRGWLLADRAQGVLLGRQLLRRLGHDSRPTSPARLSVLTPTKDGCRSRSSSVHSKNSIATTMCGFNQRQTFSFSAVIPVPQRPFDASGRFENRHSAASSFEKPLNSACLDAEVKPARILAAYLEIGIYRTLRCTPAMAAGVTDRLWSVEGLIEAALTCGIWRMTQNLETMKSEFNFDSLVGSVAVGVVLTIAFVYVFQLIFGAASNSFLGGLLRATVTAGPAVILARVLVEALGRGKQNSN